MMNLGCSEVEQNRVFDFTYCEHSGSASLINEDTVNIKINANEFNLPVGEFVMLYLEKRITVKLNYRMELIYGSI
jgi:hypothetical protein